jgi:hypothetical protein
MLCENNEFRDFIYLSQHKNVLDIPRNSPLILLSSRLSPGFKILVACCEEPLARVDLQAGFRSITFDKRAFQYEINKEKIFYIYLLTMLVLFGYLKSIDRYLLDEKYLKYIVNR